MPRELEIRNPVTRELVGRVPQSSPDDVRGAVARARTAQQRWRDCSFSHRAAVIRRFHDRILDTERLVLDTIQSETGKARRDAFAELWSVAGTVRYYLAHGQRHLREQRHRPAVPGVTSARLMLRPYGVVGVITPWNCPFLLGIADSLPALLAGNAVVLKPSELTPLSAILARDLLVECGLEGGLIPIVHGPGSDVGQALIREVDYVAFTGGTRTGRKVAMAAGHRLIPCSLELGGKNPMLVLEGSSIEHAVTGLLAGAFSNSGQSCISVERVYVHEPVYERFLEKAVDATSRLKIGWSTDWDMDVGSLISEGHAQKVISHIDDAVEKGATLVAGGARPDLGPTFVAPTILVGVDNRMKLARDETFGPVVTLERIRDSGDAIRKANDSPYGLNASVWARTRRQGLDIARQLEVGTAGINSTLLAYNSFDVPMGGVRKSGVGRRHGAAGIVRFTSQHGFVASPAVGGGYDALLLKLESRTLRRLLIAVLRLWRRIPGLR